MQKTLALIFGIVFLIVGVAGFIPVLSPANADGQLLLNIFQINTAQSVIHLLSAIAAFAAFAGGSYYARTYFRVFGVVYGAVALWGLPGFAHAFNGVLFGLIHVNLATELLHIAIAVVSLLIGFAFAITDRVATKTA